jgi:hypothetical protein
LLPPKPKLVIPEFPQGITAKRHIINEPNFEIVEYSPEMRLINLYTEDASLRQMYQLPQYRNYGFPTEKCINLALPYVQYGRYFKSNACALFVSYSNEPATLESPVWPAPLPGTYADLLICLMYNEFSRNADLPTLISKYYFSSFFGLSDQYLTYTSVRTLAEWRKLTPQTVLSVDSWGYSTYRLSQIPRMFADHGVPH